MLGSGAGAWRVATPAGAWERGLSLGHDVQHPGRDLPATGGIIHHGVRFTGHPAGCGCVSACGATGARGLAAACFGCAVFYQPGVSVDGVVAGAAGTNLKMQVRPRGAARRSDIADVGACGDGLARGDVDAMLPHVRIHGTQRLPADGVLDDDQSAVPASEFCDRDPPVGDGIDRGAVGRAVVGTGVEGTLSGEGV